METDNFQLAFAIIAQTQADDRKPQEILNGIQATQSP